MEVERTPEFEKYGKRNGLTTREWGLVEKALRFFANDPRHPGLRDGAVEGYAGVRYIRASLTLRLAYRLSQDNTRASFFWVGYHDDFDSTF